jgi:Tol biopolymer transport system component
MKAKRQRDIGMFMRLGLRITLLSLPLTGVAACAAVLGIDDGMPLTDAGASPDTATVDAGLDAKPDTADAAPRTSCDPAAPFGVATALVTLNTPSAQDIHPRLTPDELTIVFASDRLGTAGGLDLYTSTRASLQAQFNNPASLGPTVNTKYHESDPTLTPDGRTLYFSSARLPIMGPQWDIWTSTRLTPLDAFPLPTNVNALNTFAIEWSPFVSSSGSPLLFASNRGSATTLIYSSDLVDGGYGAPATLSGMNDAGVGHSDRSGTLSKDGLVLYFTSDRAGSAGQDIWVTTRASVGSPFAAPKQVAELNTPGDDYIGWISNDLCRIYFSTNKVAATTDYDLYVASRPL